MIFEGKLAFFIYKKMSAENLVENYLGNIGANNTNLSEIFTDYEDINNNTIQETSFTENNHSESEVRNNSILGVYGKNLENYIEKKDTKNIVSPMIPKNESEVYRIEALKLSKALDNYYLETALHQYWNKENEKIFIKKAKNYLPKSRICKNSPNKIGLSLKLYYKIKISNYFHCIYIDQYYRRHIFIFYLLADP